MKKTNADIDRYLENLPEAVRADMVQLDARLSELFEGEDRILWEGVFWGGSEQQIIGYGELNYERPGKPTVEWFKIGLALQKNYISLYVNAVDGKKYLTESYKNMLGKAKVGKSSIGFKSLADINEEQLDELLVRAKELLS